jgi:hypothetical protein
MGLGHILGIFYKLVWSPWQGEAACMFQCQLFAENTRVARWFVFKQKIPILGKFWRALESKMLIYFIAIWNILRPFGIFYDHFGTFCVHIVHFFWFW